MTSSPANYTGLILKKEEEREIRSAIINGNIELFKKLVNESNCNTIMNSALGVLIVQCDQESSSEMLIYLLEKGAIINKFIDEAYGETALSSALILNKNHLAIILINNCCGIDIKNKKGLTPLDLAKNKDIIKAIKNAYDKKLQGNLASKNESLNPSLRRKALGKTPHLNEITLENKYDNLIQSSPINSANYDNETVSKFSSTQKEQKQKDTGFSNAKTILNTIPKIAANPEKQSGIEHAKTPKNVLSQYFSSEHLKRLGYYKRKSKKFQTNLPSIPEERAL